MSGKDLEQNIDAEKDYYGALGLKSTATTDELKVAYVQLALLHHPDTAPAGGSDKSLSSEFIKVSEAYGVLSRPETRTRYDILRNNFLGISPANLSQPTVHSSTPSGYHSQKFNYTSKIQGKAGSTFSDVQEKRRLERWQNLPMKDKKMWREQPISSFSSGMARYLIPLTVAGVIVFSAISFVSTKFVSTQLKKK